MKGLIFVSEKTRVRLKIVGSEFVVSADEDKDYIVKISNMVDEKIKALLRQSDSMSVAMAAILAALNYCDELEKEKIITEELLRRTETSESLASRACGELDQLRVENKRLKEEKLGLHKVIDSLQSGAEAAEDKAEEPDSPEQLKIPLPNDKSQSATETQIEEIAPSEAKSEEPQQSPEPEQKQEKEKEQDKGSETEQNAQTEKQQDAGAENRALGAGEDRPSVPLTARQMLEEKRRALLEQKKNNRQSEPNQNRPKPFRPVNSAKSGGGAFPGNKRGEPKINYRDNDKISGSFRRSEFADLTGEDDMLSFFDRR